MPLKQNVRCVASELCTIANKAASQQLLWTFLPGGRDAIPREYFSALNEIMSN